MYYAHIDTQLDVAVNLNTLNPELIGYIAALLTTISFVPQAYKVFRTQHTQDLSLGMFAFFSTGVALWLTYGLMINAWPVIVANSITLVLASYILWMKIKLG